MVDFIIIPCSSLEYSAFITSANAFPQFLVGKISNNNTTIHDNKYFIENSGKQIVMISKIQTHVFFL